MNFASPYSIGWESERSFEVRLVLRGSQIPREEMMQLEQFELDMHVRKGIVGKVVIGSSRDVNKTFADWVANNLVWKAGSKLEVWCGTSKDMHAFTGLFLREPKYKFGLKGVVTEVPYRDAQMMMKREKRSRRFRNMTAAQVVQKIAQSRGVKAKYDPK